MAWAWLGCSAPSWVGPLVLQRTHVLRVYTLGVRNADVVPFWDPDLNKAKYLQALYSALYWTIIYSHRIE